MVRLDLTSCTWRSVSVVGRPQLKPEVGRLTNLGAWSEHVPHRAKTEIEKAHPDVCNIGRVWKYLDAGSGQPFPTES